MLLSCVWLSFAYLAAAAPSLLQHVQTPLSKPTTAGDIAFSETWHCLGPFQIGTRETPWSSDPLEFNRHGGFHSIDFDANDLHLSSLAFNGTVGWLNCTAELSDPAPGYTTANLVSRFSFIDWEFLQEVFGWAGHQWLSWARGKIYIHGDKAKTLAFDISNVLEYWIDDVRYFGGDFYDFQRAWVTLQLAPGEHNLDMRLVGDVRSAGGIGEPSVEVTMRLKESSPGLSLLYNNDDDVVMADVVGGDFGVLVSPYASVTVRNDAESDIYITAFGGMKDTCEVELLSDSPVKLVPGQTRPIGFRIGCVPSLNRRIDLALKYNIDGDDRQHATMISTWPKVRETMRELHKFTFLHPSGAVSYAILRPPALNAVCSKNSKTSVPVMFALHGAGVDAEHYPNQHAFDSTPDLCAWLIFPQGMTSWSGDDWHSWGFSDVEAAIAAIPAWIEAVGWTGPGVEIEKWLVSGHSNGGQGTWFALTHRPDKIIAAAALSGYSSIENYVPYTSWRTADPARTAIIQAALSSYRYDILTENTKNIPVIIQHGSADDNVPSYHSRLMHERIHEAGGESTFIEVAGEPHFWDGVSTTPPLRDFYRKNLDECMKPKTKSPGTLGTFTVIAADPGDMGSKNGVEILQLASPGQLGKIEFAYDPLVQACIFRSSNVRALRLGSNFKACSPLIIDRQELSTAPLLTESTLLVKDKKGWALMEDDANSLALFQKKRWGRQLGSISSIIRTAGAFQIVRHSKATEQIALQVSRNLCQYLAADTEVTDDYGKALLADGNIISISIGNDMPKGIQEDFAIQVGHDVVIREHDWTHTYIEDGRGLGAIFLRPLPNERLELVIWGFDEDSLRMAARLAPMMTGSGQPDFVVMDNEMMWRGLDGTLALGLFDGDWEMSRNTYFT